MDITSILVEIGEHGKDKEGREKVLFPVEENVAVKRYKHRKLRYKKTHGKNDEANTVCDFVITGSIFKTVECQQQQNACDMESRQLVRRIAYGT